MAKATDTKEMVPGTTLPANSVNNLLQQKEAKELKSVEDIVNRFTNYGGKVYDIAEIQPDFALVDSTELVNVPFTVALFQNRESEEFGQYNEDGILIPGGYYSVYVITDDGRRLVFNDGGTGIVPVAEHFINTTKQNGGMRCPWGLRASTYEKTIDGKKVKATTMYFATSKPKTT